MRCTHMNSWRLSLGEGPEGLRRHSGVPLVAGTYSGLKSNYYTLPSHKCEALPSTSKILLKKKNMEKHLMFPKYNQTMTQR